MFAVRKATSADRDAVHSILDASYSLLLRSHYAPELLDAALPAMTAANPSLLASGTYYIAEARDGRAIGCGGWTMQQPGTGVLSTGVAHVRHFATHPDWLRCGVGQALLRRCLAETSQCDVRLIECYSTLGAEKFYASAGFCTVRPIEIPITCQINFPAILMHRTLKQKGCGGTPC